MRLWHHKLIRYLPNSQLLGQWRELNSIFKKQNKHILINYIYEYSEKDLLDYSYEVWYELTDRGYHCQLTNFLKYFKMSYRQFERFLPDSSFVPFKNHHNNEYLTICYWNLREKYIRGQKDFTKGVWNQIENYYKEAENGKL